MAVLTTDNREPFREYHKLEPWFGAAHRQRGKQNNGQQTNEGTFLKSFDIAGD